MMRITLLVAAASIVGACTYSGPNHQYPGFGEATAHNAAVMIIDPNPPGAQNTDIPMDGSRAVLAQERYRTDTVVEPEMLDTTDALSAGTN